MCSRLNLLIVVRHDVIGNTTENQREKHNHCLLHSPIVVAFVVGLALTLPMLKIALPQVLCPSGKNKRVSTAFTAFPYQLEIQFPENYTIYGHHRARGRRLGLGTGSFSKNHTMLKGLDGVQNYLDDVIVYEHTASQHDHNLQAVLTAQWHSGLTLNQAKCKFSCSSLPYLLVHTLTAQGLLPNHCHIQARIAPAPTDPAELCSFLILASWYLQLVPNYSSEVKPLRA